MMRQIWVCGQSHSPSPSPRGYAEEERLGQQWSPLPSPVSCGRVDESSEMTSDQGRPLSDAEKEGVDVGPILDQLGHMGRYQAIQMTLCLLASALGVVPHMDYVFTGYQPDYRCKEVEELDEYLPNDVTNFTLTDLQYHECSIDVTVSTSGIISTHSLPCVSGINFSMPSYTSFHTEWSLVCDKEGLTELTQTVVFAGEAAGFLLSSYVADRYGRKRVNILCSLGTLLAHVSTSLAPSYYLFLVGKTLTGFFRTSMVHSAYTILMELLPDKWRCVTGALDSVVGTVASVHMAVVAYCLQDVSWRYLSVAFDLLFVYAVVLPWLLDESLRWLLATGNVKEAERILEKACRMNGKDFETIRTVLQHQILKGNLGGRTETDGTDKAEEKREQEAERTDNNENEHIGPEEKVSGRGALIADMVDGACTEGRVAEGDHRDPLQNSDAGPDGQEWGNSGSAELHDEATPAKYNVLDLFRHRVVFVPFVVVTLVWVTNGLYYNTTMLGSAKLSGDRFLNFALLHLQSIPAVLVATFLLSRFNRRPVAFIFGFTAACFLLISVALAIFGGKEGLNDILGTVAKYMGMFSLEGSLTALFLYFMEVFPTTLRAVGSGAAGTVAKVTEMAAPFLLLWGEETSWAPGILVGCLCCLASLSIWLLPETRHRKLPDTIEEMQAWTKKGNAL